MSRNLALQILRGVQANRPVLNDGEFYFCTDTGNLFVGLGGGVLQVEANMAINIADPTTSTNVAAVQPKGTQGTFMLCVQDAKDTGRLFAVYSTTVTAAAANTEELASLTPLGESVSGTLTTGTAATNFTVPSGKRFRIQSLNMSVVDITTAEVSGSARVTLRIANNTAITTSSPVLASAASNFVMATAVLGQGAGAIVDFPDGLELSGTENFGVSYLASTVECSITISLVGYFY